MFTTCVLLGSFGYLYIVCFLSIKKKKMFSIFEKKKTMNLKCLDEIEKLNVLIFQIQSNFSSVKYPFMVAAKETMSFIDNSFSCGQGNDVIHR